MELRDYSSNSSRLCSASSLSRSFFPGLWAGQSRSCRRGCPVLGRPCLLPAGAGGEGPVRWSCGASLEVKCWGPNPCCGVPRVSAISRAPPAWRLGGRSRLSRAEEPRAAGRALRATGDPGARPGPSLLPLAARGDAADTSSQPGRTNREARAVLGRPRSPTQAPGWLTTRPR